MADLKDTTPRMTRRDLISGITVATAAVAGGTGFGYTTGGIPPHPLKKEECPECVALGWRHKTWVQHHYDVTAMMGAPGYWDEDGNWHAPCDPNITTRYYKCSNGHQWSKKTRHPCNEED